MLFLDVRNRFAVVLFLFHRRPCRYVFSFNLLFWLKLSATDFRFVFYFQENYAMVVTVITMKNRG